MKQQKQLYDILGVNLCLQLRSLIRNSSNGFLRNYNGISCPCHLKQ